MWAGRVLLQLRPLAFGAGRCTLLANWFGVDAFLGLQQGLRKFRVANPLASTLLLELRHCWVGMLMQTQTYHFDQH